MTGVIALLDQPRTLDALANATTATIYFYYTGTTNLAPIYEDYALTTPASNPIALAAGEIFPTTYLDPAIRYRRRIVYGDGTVQDVPIIEGSGVNASQVSYESDGTGAVTRNVAQELDAIGVTPEQYGAVGDGVTDDTTAMQNSILAAMEQNVPWILSGDYFVTAAILDEEFTSVGEGSLTIYCRSPSTITIDPTAPTFRILFYSYINHDLSYPHVLFMGAQLDVNCNGRAAEAFRFRRPDAASEGGSIIWQSQVIIRDCHEDGASETEENAAFWAIGPWEAVWPFGNLYVDGVSRVNAAGGACSGLAVAIGDPLVIVTEGSKFHNITHPVGGTDADGIKILSATNTDYSERPTGMTIIRGVEFRNCGGRAVKSQSVIDVDGCVVFRGGALAVAPMTETVEFDGQRGALPVRNCKFFYEPRSGGGTPLGSGHALVALQANNDYADRQSAMDLYCETNFAFPYAVVIVRARPEAGDVEIIIDGIEVRAVDALVGSSVFSSGVVQFNANEVAAVATDATPGRTYISVKNVRAATSVPIVSYNGLVTSAAKQNALRDYLRVDVDFAESTLGGTSPQAVTSVGGDTITKPVFNTGQNLKGVRQLYASSQTIDLRLLRGGTAFTIYDNLVTLLPSEPSSFAAGHEVLVEIKQNWFDKDFQWIEMKKTSGTPTIWASQNSGTSWFKWEGAAA